MTTSIRITWPGGDRTFPAGSTVSIGRDPASTIRLADERVSRRHAEFRSTPDGWMLTDLGSTSGSFIGSERVQEVLVRTTTTVRFGGITSNDDVSFSPIASPGPPTGPVGAPTELAAPVLLDATVLPAPTHARPGGVLAPNAAAGATEVSGDTLHIQFGDGTKVVHPADVVVLGRGTPELRTDNPTVSRQHVRLSHQGDGWYVEDLQSSRGTFLDGRRITRQRVQGSMAFTVGPPESGERLVVVASGADDRSISKRLRSPRTLALLSTSAVVLAVLALGAVLLLRGGDDVEAVSAADLRAATVLIVTDSGSGSGTIIDGERGLILTNAHVARPDAPGQVLLYGEGEGGLPTSQREVEIYLSGSDDETARPTYLGQVIAFDGYLDFAVVEITRTITGSLIDLDDLDLPDIPLGDSEVLEQGDRIQMIGYPSGVSGSLSPQADSATVAGFALDERIGDNRAWINSSINISAGNSGGLAADEQGRLIGVPSAERMVDGDEVSRLRPIHLALPLIEAARAGQEYASPFVTPAENEQITITGLATPGELFSTSCRNRFAAQVVDPFTLSFIIEYEGFPNGHQDLRVIVVGADDELLGLTSTADVWPFEWEGEGCAVVSVPLASELPAGTEVTVLFDVGPNYELLLPSTTIPV